MLVGGRDQGSDNEFMEPWFFSLNASCPLAECLDGTKNEIDGNVRRRPALIKTEGKREQIQVAMMALNVVCLR